MRWRHFGVAVAVLVSLFALNFILQINISPAFRPLSTDSGVFAYCGARMLAGDVLYTDCWDNKPPLVYLVNAAIVALGGQNPWAIWWFQLFSTTFASAAIYWVARRAWRNWLPAAFSTALFIGTALTPAYYSGGNLTETYLLLILALTAGALYASLDGGKLRWTFALGLLTAAAVLLKPTYFGLGVASAFTVLCLHLARRNWLSIAKHLAGFTSGLILPLGLTVAVLWRQGALGDFWFAAFQHNAGYVADGFSRLTGAETLRQLFAVQPLAGLVWMALAGLLCFGLVHHFFRRQAPPAAQPDIRAWWLGGLLLALPLQAFSIGISGKNFGHYYLEIIPALALLASAGLAILLQRCLFRNRAALSVILGLALAGLAGVWAKGLNAGELFNPTHLAHAVKNTDLWTYAHNDLEQYILDHSRPEQSVLIWGTHVDFNFTTGRRSPTRYIFPLHVLTNTPQGPTGFAELLAELEEDPPHLIIQQAVSSAGLPSLTASESELCNFCTPQALRGMQDLQEYVLSRYTLKIQIYDWQVFERKP